MHLVRQTETALNLLKTIGDCMAMNGRIPPWMVDFGHRR
jgi:hypothetical protein